MGFESNPIIVEKFPFNPGIINPFLKYSCKINVIGYRKEQNMLEASMNIEGSIEAKKVFKYDENVRLLNIENVWPFRYE